MAKEQETKKCNIDYTCPKCGKENTPGSLMCIKCGYSFNVPNAGKRTADEEKALEEARISMENKCKNPYAVFSGCYSSSPKTKANEPSNKESIEKDEVLKEYLYWISYVDCIAVTLKKKFIKICEQYDPYNLDSTDYIYYFDIYDPFFNAIDKQWHERYHKKQIYCIYLPGLIEKEKEYSDFVNESLKVVSDAYEKVRKAYEVTRVAKDAMLEQNTRGSGNVGIFVRDLPSFLLAQTLLGIQDYRSIKEIDRKGEEIFQNTLQKMGVHEDTPKALELQIVCKKILPKAMNIIDDCRILAVNGIMQDFIGDDTTLSEYISEEHLMIPGKYGVTKALLKSNELLEHAQSNAEMKEALLNCPYNTNAYTYLLNNEQEIELVRKYADFFEYELEGYANLDIALDDYRRRKNSLIERKASLSGKVTQLDKELSETTSIHFVKRTKLQDDLVATKLSLGQAQQELGILGNVFKWRKKLLN